VSQWERFRQNYLVGLVTLPVILISPLAFVPFIAIPAGLTFGVILRIRQIRDECFAMLAALVTWVGVIATVRYFF
jgi:hypothetical protein